MTAPDPARSGDRGPAGDDRTFEAPWQARAFALAVALTGEEDLPWEAFQSRLVEEIDRDDEASESSPDRPGVAADDADATYYRQWLAALERLLVEEGLLAPGELTERIDAFERGDRSAHEFVAGDPHGHADRLPDGHAEGSDHDHGDHDHDDHDH